MKQKELTRADVRYTLTAGKSLTLFVRGKQKTYLGDDPLFNQLIDCIKNQYWEKLDKLMNPEALIEKLSKGALKVTDGVVWMGTDSGEKELPEELNSTVLQFMNDNLPYDYLVNFALKLFANPSEDAIKQLYKYLVKNQFPICEDGDFVAYRKVTDDFRDFRTGDFDNSIGSVVEMDRKDVDPDPTRTCSKGLHAANWDYVHNHYYPGQGRIVVMKINPADVVSIPNDYNDSKMRVCKFYVLEEVKEEYSGPRAYKYETSEEDLNDEYEEGYLNEETCDCEDSEDHEEQVDLTLPDRARPHTILLFNEIILGRQLLTNSQDVLDELAIVFNEALSFSTGEKMIYVLSEKDYDWFFEKINSFFIEKYEDSRTHVTDTFSFYDGLRLVRGKKQCIYPEILDLRAASRNGKLKVFNKKKLDKEYRDLLGLE